jgi:hypothetical protein
MHVSDHGGLLRARDGGEQQVTPFELFFDLVYVFAVTQLSHRLLDELTVVSTLETLLLLLVVWSAWVTTTWVTNWFDPNQLWVRLMLVTVMLASLFMSVAIPEAFGERGLMFALAYVTIQVGRAAFAFITLRDSLGVSHPLSRTFQRTLFWHVCSGPVRSNTVSPGYSTKAIIFSFCSSVGISARLLFARVLLLAIGRRQTASAEQPLVQVGPACERPLQIRLVLGYHGRELILARAAVLLDAPERRMRVVLDNGLYVLGFLLILQPGYQVERHVNSSRHPCGGDKPAVVHPVPFDAVHPQLLKELPVRRVGARLSALK